VITDKFIVPATNPIILPSLSLIGAETTIIGFPVDLDILGSDITVCPSRVL